MFPPLTGRIMCQDLGTHTSLIIGTTPNSSEGRVKLFGRLG